MLAFILSQTSSMTVIGKIGASEFIRRARTWNLTFSPSLERSVRSHLERLRSSDNTDSTVMSIAPGHQRRRYEITVEYLAEVLRRQNGDPHLVLTVDHGNDTVAPFFSLPNLQGGTLSLIYTLSAAVIKRMIGA